MATVGCRITSEGHYGTVRFIGKVPPTSGEWLGVEWDNPERGKHDGMHEGQRYFQTSHPTSGSFVREKKAEFGISYLEALIDRYGLPEDENMGIEKSEWFVKTYGQRQKAVEMVGAEKVARKQSDFKKLSEVALREMRISSADNEDEIQDTTPNVTELDLSKNLLSSWEEVAKITRSMKSLKVLKLSENLVELPSEPSVMTPAFQNVETLFINHMKLTWSEVVAIAAMFQNLKNLHVCFNQISKVEKNENIFQSLELLNLESNHISEWNQVKNLGHLPRLTTLILNNNAIERIQFEDTSFGAKTSSFQHLKSISLNDNKLNSWQDVNELDKLAGLEEVRLKRNPFLKDEKSFIIRQLLIAKIGALINCNGSEVPTIERRTAELDYLKKFGQEWLKSGGDRDPARNRPNGEFCKNHPRYHTLLEIYGAPEDSEMSAAPSTALKNTLIHVSITCPQKPETKTVSKKLPGSMTVQKLKMLIQRLFKVSTSDQKLAYISKKIGEPEVEIDNDMRQLSFYSIENEDTIVVKF
ncbi:tubulin-specific chaperone E-like [Ptychodera flava]|uniref:tubulin-specific chaperone E-like n=1 Tax=Ptychodera flava TaxID=63121 RepID=UPI00396A21F2